MDFRAVITTIDHGTGVPESPSSEWSSAWDLRGIGLEEVELVDGVVAD